VKSWFEGVKSRYKGIRVFTCGHKHKTEAKAIECSSKIRGRRDGTALCMRGDGTAFEMRVVK